jgi:zinc transport system permease protein
VTIVLSIKVVGMILVAALLVIPGLTALQLDMSFRDTVISAILFGVISVVVGIFASALFNVATSGVIVFALVAFFLIIAVWRRLTRA